MRLTITSQGHGDIRIDFGAHAIGLSGMEQGGCITVDDCGGALSVSLHASPEAQVQPLTPPVAEAQAEATAEIQPEPQAETAAEATPETAPEAHARPQPQAAPEQEQLFRQLVALRKRIAAEVKLPPYIIFHDATLKEMCRLLPVDLQALKGIQGVGTAKLEKYGERFIEAIREYTAAHSVGEAA